MRWLPFEIHPDTPPEGAPKPFSPGKWPEVRERLKRLAQEVGLPIDPPQRNVNSRFALETAELVRAQKGDDEAGTFCHHVSRAFFTEHADISKHEVIVPIAERFGISASEVETAWHERRFLRRSTPSLKTGTRPASGVFPAMAWPNRRAIVGLMPPSELVLRLRNEAPERSRE